MIFPIKKNIQFVFYLDSCHTERLAGLMDGVNYYDAYLTNGGKRSILETHQIF